MRIVIAGGHGQIALLLERILAERGDTPVGLIRSAEQADDLHACGAESLLCDLESVGVDQLAAQLAGADAAVFAAGAGGRGGAGRTQAVDQGGAVLFAEAAERAGIRRLVQLSSMGADREPSPDTDPGFASYLRAKAAADEDLATRTHMDWTILRPGHLTDAPGTGLVTLAPHTGVGSVPRQDVAAVIAHLLQTPATAGLALELISGDTPVEAAVHSATP
ncbi:NAD(P)H-binding protein [Streptacidiphilus sp. PB12-B1b]|uniref:NAD(P)H-binding protein n=1 Tax=Streptacidiphilus sp. PB12-B1b TaxID=2705012 RepID=UPI0015F80297|nr:NAD(P)H-binding protein [Streptacidiphilus sp. PB12-B1b]QMU75036.1 NAD(P)H-binding protein [Streptacidiphilus sp. PB12-B1b]